MTILVKSHMTCLELLGLSKLNKRYTKIYHATYNLNKYDNIESRTINSANIMTSSFNIHLLQKCDYVKNNDNEISWPHPKSTLENFFSSFRKNIVGGHKIFDSPFGKKQIIYADWTASGRAYQPIEAYIQKEIMPFVGNTQTE